MVKKSVRQLINGLLLTVVSALAIGCGTPVAPMQASLGTVVNYNKASVQKTFQTQSTNNRLSTYNDGTVAVSNVPFIQQGDDNTCGQASMTMILNFWGKNANYQKVINDTNPNNMPTDVSAIKTYLQSKGLKVNDYKKSSLDFLKSLINNGKPAIVLLDYGSASTLHYVVVTGYNDKTKQIIINDSIDGPNQRISFDQFGKWWQNTAATGLRVFNDKYERVVLDISC